MHGWQMAVYVGVVLVLLLLGRFKLDELLVKRKQKKGPQLVKRRSLQHPDGRLTDPHGHQASSAPTMERRARRGPTVVR